MNRSMCVALLVFVEVLLGFAILCVAPFAWILRDGLGPSSVQTSGVEALSKAFMTFYIGPAIFLLIVIDLGLRRVTPRDHPLGRGTSFALWVVGVALFGALTYLVVGLLFD